MGEKMEAALKREILEETGLEIYDIQLISVKESIFSTTLSENKHFIFIDYQCKTNSTNVVLNEEAEEYVWVDLVDIDKYDLGGFIRPLLLKLRDREESSAHKVEIFYGY